MGFLRTPVLAAVAGAIMTGLTNSVCSAQSQPGALQGYLGAGPGWNIHTQATYIDQFHYSFPSEYEGPNSFEGASEEEHTFSWSLFLGRELGWGCDLFYDPEIFQGHGLSHTYGIAGFPNGEAVKSGFANLHYNTSRLFVRRTIGLGGETETVEDDANQFAGKVDVDRLVLSAGKFSANDFFDGNAYSHDPRTQFMNWALWESAAWDYPADIVGFTEGAVIEWNRKNTEWHLGIFMEPHEANGLRMDPHVGKAHSEVLQYDFGYSAGGLHGILRTFVYWNQANMGSYAVAALQTKPENIVLTRAYRSKEGLGASWDQKLAGDIGAFVRLSWNDGRTESFTFTEIDRSVAGGLSLGGKSWGRPSDTAGLALAVNGLSAGHRHYLENGGTGLILGDGALEYSPEELVEAYYSIQPEPWLQVGPDFQYIRNPGYNAARGPVPVFAVRAHMEF